MESFRMTLALRHQTLLPRDAGDGGGVAHWRCGM